MFKKWMLKACIQKTISILPFSFKINYFFQKYITKAVRLNQVFFFELINDGNKLLKQFEKEDRRLDQLHFLELGTGWHPILPIYFYLCGAQKICTIDLNQHLRKENFLELITMFLEQYQAHALSSMVQAHRVSKLNSLLEKSKELSLEKMLESINIYTKVGDFTKMTFKDPYDLCFSVNVLEHINETVLKEIIASFHKNSKEQSWHFHSFGAYDHFCHIDKSISKFNFLKFSKKTWQCIDNNIQPQNRLRVCDFEKLFLNQGFKLSITMHSEPNIKELDKIEIHPDFKSISKEICAIDYGAFIFEK